MEGMRFRPAQADDPQVFVTYFLTVNFDKPLCDNLLVRAERAEKGPEGSLTLDFPSSDELPARISLVAIDPPPEASMRKPRTLRLRVRYEIPAEVFDRFGVTYCPRFSARCRAHRRGWHPWLRTARR
jgi:hypothetical protein